MSERKYELKYRPPKLHKVGRVFLPNEDFKTKGPILERRLRGYNFAIERVSQLKGEVGTEIGPSRFNPDNFDGMQKAGVIIEAGNLRERLGFLDNLLRKSKTELI